MDNRNIEKKMLYKLWSSFMKSVNIFKKMLKGLIEVFL